MLQRSPPASVTLLHLLAHRAWFLVLKPKVELFISLAASPLRSIDTRRSSVHPYPPSPWDPSSAPSPSPSLLKCSAHHDPACGLVEIRFVRLSLALYTDDHFQTRMETQMSDSNSLALSSPAPHSSLLHRSAVAQATHLSAESRFTHDCSKLRLIIH